MDMESGIYVGGSSHMGPCQECGLPMECITEQSGLIQPEDMKPQVYRCENGHERTLEWRRNYE